MRKHSKIEGLIAPVFTPMKDNGDINMGIISHYAKDLKSKDLAGIFVSGSSGEGVLLTTEERKIITEAWAPYASDEFKFIVHVGSTSYRQSQELATHASDNGAWAISSMGPTFLQPKTTEDLVEFCRLIASSAPELPFYYYHFPMRTGVDISMVEFLQEGIKVIPNLTGIKFTHSNFMEMQQCISLDNGRFDITHGHDEILLCGLSIGVKGAIGITYNFIPGLYLEIIELFNDGKIQEARKLQQVSVKIIKIIAKYGGGIVAGKAMAKMTGIDCGPCRSPLRSLSSQEYKNLEKELEEIGFFNMVANQNSMGR
ncbi:MAG: dihydrodipicolinate synthase family protein [Bacteroidales bacterium]|nr:dihydrodipicolinate synthase family protein [Bacteroidales bacterium]